MNLSVSHLSSKQQTNLGSTSLQYSPSSSIFKYFLDYSLCDNSSICPTIEHKKTLETIEQVFKGKQL
jgi:hypothetical protein